MRSTTGCITSCLADRLIALASTVNPEVNISMTANYATKVLLWQLAAISMFPGLQHTCKSWHLMSKRRILMNGRMLSQ